MLMNPKAIVKVNVCRNIIGFILTQKPDYIYRKYIKIPYGLRRSVNRVILTHVKRNFDDL